MLQNTDQTSVVTVTAPASKSLSHRYLIGAALAGGESTVRHTLESADLECTRAILCGAGARMEALDASGNGAGNNSGGWRVQGLGGAPRPGAPPGLRRARIRHHLPPAHGRAGRR